MGGGIAAGRGWEGRRECRFKDKLDKEEERRMASWTTWFTRPHKRILLALKGRKGSVAW